MKRYWWQRIETSIVHSRYRVVVDYEVCDDYEHGTQNYTGRSEMSYIPV